MSISAADIKNLRTATGAGIADCKKALQEADGDQEKAIEFLRKKGLAAAKKKAGRITSEGSVHAYIHGGGRVGVLVEVNCETDFVAATDDFKAFVHDVALHVAAFSPQYVRREDMPASVLEKEKQLQRERALEEGKPEKIVERIVEGRVNKYFGEVCLLEQPWVKDQDQTTQQVLTELVAKIGENVSIRRFVRYELGEGLEKRADNLAEEVAKQIG